MRTYCTRQERMESAPLGQVSPDIDSYCICLCCSDKHQPCHTAYTVILIASDINGSDSIVYEHIQAIRFSIGTDPWPVRLT